MARAKSPSSSFTVLYFASASEFTSKNTEELPAPLQAIQLFAELEKRYPGIGEQVLSTCAVTVNLEYIEIEGEDAEHRDLIIKEGDEVGIIPPVSSG